MTWLVTGGAGYIGVHITLAMLEAGERVVLLDALSTGDAARVPEVPLVVGSVLDVELVGRTLRNHGIRGIVHVAAKKQVEESVRRPLHYYRENIEGLRGGRCWSLRRQLESTRSSSPPARPSTALRTSTSCGRTRRATR